MRIVLFEAPDGAARYGRLVPGGVVAFGGLAGDTPREQLLHLIDSDSARRAEATTANPMALDRVRLLPPVSWPGKILITTATYGARAEPPPQLLMTLKSAESVIGPDGTVRLPSVDPGAWQFVPQAMLGLVLRGPAKDVPPERWYSAVFGYTCVIDVMARGDQQFGRDFWLAKSDTLNPLGPCIVTIDELPDPASLRVRTWRGGEPVQDFRIADASHSIADQVALATTIMTLHTGDIVACGTATEDQPALEDGDSVEVEIDGIGRLGVRVAAPVTSRV